MDSSVNASPFRGVYAIPPTPFDQEDQLDERSLRRVVEFCVMAGAHGIVAPVNASEAIILTDAERLRVAEILVEQTAGRVPVIIGVSGVSTAASVLYTKHAAEIGADAVIAMPPYVKHPASSEIPGFYADVARAGQGMPVWIQNNLGPVSTPMSPELLTRMLRDIPEVAFIKEESEHATQVISRVRELAVDDLKGIMGGTGGRFLLEEYRRGACGTMPASEVADALVLVWNALERDDSAEARRVHTQLLPMLNYEALYTYAIYKEILVKRGVIASSRSRVPGAPMLDDENHREIDSLLHDIEPLLTLGMHPEIPV
jgi:dihydrodipicolinate synthase/N-acetylneuraminate lyase